MKKEIKSGIYMIKNIINNKIYVGQSVDLDRRKSMHFSSLKNNHHHNKYLQNSYNKYGKENFIFEIIEYCPISELDKKEEYWVDKLESRNIAKGYNLIDGGAGGNKEWNVREIVCLNNKQHFKSLSSAVNFASVSSSTISSCLNHHTYSAGEYNGERLVWRYAEEYNELSENDMVELIKIANAPYISNKCKSVVLLNTGEEYYSIGEASRKTGISTSAIIMSCSGNAKYGGKEKDGTPMIWFYSNDYYNLNPEEVSHLKNTLMNRLEKKKTNKAVILLNTNEIFESVKCAAAAYNLSKHTVSSCCNKKTKYCKKKGIRLFWMFYDEYVNYSDEEIRQIYNKAMNADKTGNNKSVVLVNTGKVYKSIKSAAIENHVDSASIVNVCKDTYNRINIDSNKHELFWMYKDEYDELSAEEINEYLLYKSSKLNDQNHDSIILLNTLEKFDKYSDASKKYNVAQGCIAKCCKHIYNSAGKLNDIPLIWVYYEEYKNMNPKEIESYLKEHIDLCLNKNKNKTNPIILLNTLEVFKQAKIAGEHYNVSASSIIMCCRGKQLTCGTHPKTGERLKWMYYDEYLKAKPNDNNIVA